MTPSSFGLYRSLLRYGQRLQLTDRNLFQRRLRAEFEAARAVRDPLSLALLVRKGQAFLRLGRLV